MQDICLRVRVPVSVGRVVEKMAENEDRTMSNALRTLIREALVARGVIDNREKVKKAA